MGQSDEQNILNLCLVISIWLFYSLLILVIKILVRMNKENVLVMSLRATSTEVAKEILDAWFTETVKEDEKPTIAHLGDIETRHK